jgi:hypothetical protein
MPLPLVLAGPILRRVEPRLVSVWVALSAPRVVGLRVWQGLQTASTTQRPLGEENDEEAMADTIRVGDSLHIALVVKTFPEPLAPLVPDQLYSYDIRFFDPAPGGTLFDIQELGLLQDGILHGRPHLALGYGADQLPSFALPPLRLEDLRLFQGSCRRMHEEDVDALAFLDDFIREHRANPVRRPHQLFLTGDQIYADEVASPLLPAITRVGIELIGSHLGADEETVPHERLPVKGDDYPADQTHFPAGRRQALVRSEANFSTVGGHSHLLSLGEYCAMYLFAWSNVLWPDTLPSIDRTLDGPPSAIDHLDVLTDLDDLDEVRELYTAEARQASQTQHLFDIVDDDTGTFNTVLTSLDLGQVTPEVRAEFAGQPLGASATVTVEIEGHQWRIEDQGELQVYYLERQLGPIRVYRWTRTLAKVRRLLANVPTYMSPDDHEVTDDWNFRQEWRDRVYSTPLGRTVVRNGIVAYALFQGWGSDPQRFTSGPNKELLDKVEELFPPGSTQGPAAAAVARIETLLGLDGGDPPVRWHFTVPGTRHQVLVLDCRTRRTYPSRFAPPILLSEDALREQIPGTPPVGVDVFFVVSPLPLVGAPALEELIQPLSVRAFDVIKRAFRPLGEDARIVSETDPDMESWAFASEGLEKVLARLEPYQRVVALSGDVHFASGQTISYWKSQSGAPSRIAQFTSSGVKMLLPWYIRAIFRRLSLAMRIQRLLDPAERVAWEQTEPAPVRLPEGIAVAPALRSRLHHEPVLLGNHAWPAGTCTTRTPDWSWRLRVLADQRPDAERPAPVQPQDFGSDADPTGATDRDAALDVYRRVAVRQADVMDKMDFSRKALFPSNLGEVNFRLGPHYQVNAETLEALAEAGVPAPVLENLRHLADRSPEDQADFTQLLAQVLAPVDLSQHQAAILDATEVGSLLARHVLYAEHPSDPGHPRDYLVHTALLETPREQPPKLGDGPCQDP